MVIAGGRGERLGLNIPKCMLEISGKKLIDICIGSLTRQGFRRFVFLLGFRHDVVKNHIGDGSRYGIEAKFSIDPHSESGWGKGKAFKSALANRIIGPRQRSLVVFPDDLITDDSTHKKFLAHHIQCVRKYCALASIVLASGMRLPYATARTNPEGMVIEFSEKPVVPYQVSVGLYAFEPAVYEMIDASINLADPEPLDLESTVLSRLAKDQRLASMSIDSGMWLPINTIKEYEQALKAKFPNDISSSDTRKKRLAASD